jgi:hypothetical protein
MKMKPLKGADGAEAGSAEISVLSGSGRGLLVTEEIGDEKQTQETA